MYKLILADGTELTGFTKNGDNYIRKEKVDESVFKDNLSTLEITDGEETITMHNAEWKARGYVTKHGLQNFLEMYDAYHALGGNGMVTELLNEVKELPIKG